MTAHTHDHSHTQPDTGDIKAVFFLNLIFTLFEIVGSLWINSVAVLSDALHDLGDSLSLGLAWFLERYSAKGRDKHYSYGYRRFSLLGALLNAIVLIGGALIVLSATIPRLFNPETFNSSGMILFAVVGIAVNGIATLRLRNTTSANAQVVAWHLLEDVLGWAAVLIVGIISLFADIPILDPILSILITIYVLFNVFHRLKANASLFLQAVPRDIDLDKIEQRLLAINGVQSLHHTHIWSLDGEHNVFSAHLVVSQDVSREEIVRIKRQSREAIADLGMSHTTIEIEYEGEECLVDDMEHQPS